MKRKQKNKSLLRAEDYTPACAFCLHGKPSPDGNNVLCTLRGVMRKQSCCKRYEYDPIKREPARAPLLPEYDPEQFVI